MFSASSDCYLRLVNEISTKSSAGSPADSPARNPSRARTLLNLSIDVLCSTISLIRFSAHCAAWQVSVSWHRLTDGRELDALWNQFKSEAHASTRLYRQDVALNSAVSADNWKRPCKMFAALFLPILYKLSPARRLFLLAIF
jgi:hypothetical protein